jgi:hypothetical protein
MNFPDYIFLTHADACAFATFVVVLVAYCRFIWKSY